MGQLEDLRMFTSIVDAGSISRAADAQNIAKSAVSRRLSLLEQELGSQLIIRNARQWQLTDAGQTLYARAIKILSDMDDLAADFCGAAETQTGAINISVPLEFGNYFLNPVLISFSNLYPEIFLNVDFTDKFVDLVEGNYDLALRISQLKDSSMIARKLADVHHVLCASPDYLDRMGQIDVPEDLKSHDIIHYGSGKRFKWVLNEDLSDEVSVLLSAKMTTNNAQFMLAVASVGKGIIRIPEFLAQPMLSTGELVKILPSFIHKKLGMYAIYPANKHLPRRVRLLLDHLIQECGQR